MRINRTEGELLKLDEETSFIIAKLYNERRNKRTRHGLEKRDSSLESLRKIMVTKFEFTSFLLAPTQINRG